MTGTETTQPNPPVGKAHTMFMVRYGVAGAHRIRDRHFTTLADAREFAARWRNSNSIGSYHAQIWNGGNLVESSNGTIHVHDDPVTRIGLCSGCTSVSGVDVEGGPLRGSAVIVESSTLFSWDVAKIVSGLRRIGVVDRDANITVSLPTRAPGVATATWAVSV